MAKENLTIEDLRDNEFHVIHADVDRIILEDVNAPPNRFIVIQATSTSELMVSYLKEVKTKS
jgi:hypothetical protein